MSFFENLNDAFEDNSGLFMAAGLMNAMSISSSQRAIAETQMRLAEQNRVQAELEQEYREEQLALQRMAFEAQQEERARQEEAAKNLKRFRSLLSYCQILLEHDDPFGYLLGTLEVFKVSLQSIFEECHPTTEDIERYQRLRIHIDALRKKLAAGPSSNSFDVAVKRLQYANSAIEHLDDICSEIHSTSQSWFDGAYTSLSNRDFMQVVMQFAGAPWDQFQYDSPIDDAKKRLTDRKGLIACSDDDWANLSSQLSAWSTKMIPNIQTKINALNNEIASWLESSQQFRIPACERTVTTTTQDSTPADAQVVLSLSYSGHTNHVLLHSTMQTFVGMLEQATTHDDHDAAEFSGFKLVSKKARQTYSLFLGNLKRVNSNLGRCLKLFGLWQSVVAGEMVAAAEQGVQKVLRFNVDTIERQEAAKAAERQRRLDELKARRGQSGPSTRNTEHRPTNSRFDNLRKMREQKNRFQNSDRFHDEPEASSPNSDHGGLGQNVSPNQADLAQAWSQLNASFRNCLRHYQYALTPAGKIAAAKVGGHPELELTIREFHAQVMMIHDVCNDECLSQLTVMIEELRPACDLADVCLSWPALGVGGSLSLAETVRAMKRRDVSSADAYINALCAMAASDGDFCKEEKFAVNRWVSEARINVSAQAAGNVIDHWCRMARDQSILRMIAQSVVDCSVLAGTPLAPKLLQGVSAVLRADGKATQAETELFQLIQTYLGIKTK